MNDRLIVVLRQREVEMTSKPLTQPRSSCGPLQCSKQATSQQRSSQAPGLQLNYNYATASKTHNLTLLSVTTLLPQQPPKCQHTGSQTRRVRFPHTPNNHYNPH